MAQRYRLTYDSGLGGLVEWDKTLDELLAPNGEDSLLVWMLKTADERGLEIRLESYSDDVDDENLRSWSRMSEPTAMEQGFVAAMRPAAEATAT